MIRLAAAALGTLVLTVWALGVSYGAPEWLIWGNFTIGTIVIVTLGTLRTSDFVGFATWPMAGMVLVAMWLFGLHARGSHVFAWLDLVLGAGLWSITIAELTEGVSIRSFRPHGGPSGLHLHRPTV
jgi:hypothetical protein